MNEGNFYYGHDLKWMQKFKKAIPKKQHYSMSIAFCLACCIHHRYKCSGQITFRLSHKNLIDFGLSRKYLKLYLEAFQQAALIKYEIKKGKSPLITLLCCPKQS